MLAVRTAMCTRDKSLWKDDAASVGSRSELCACDNYKGSPSYPRAFREK